MTLNFCSNCRYIPLLPYVFIPNSPRNVNISYTHRRSKYWSFAFVLAIAKSDSETPRVAASFERRPVCWTNDTSRLQWNERGGEVHLQSHRNRRHRVTHTFGNIYRRIILYDVIIGKRSVLISKAGFCLWFPDVINLTVMRVFEKFLLWYILMLSQFFNSYES